MGIGLIDLSDSLTAIPTGCAGTGVALRVLHVVPSLRGGGVERGLVRLLEEFARSDHRDMVHGVCVLRDGDSELLRRCGDHARLWVYPSRIHRSWQADRTAWRRLRSVMDAFAPDVVHARTTGSWFDAALATRGWYGLLESCLRGGRYRRTARLLLAFHGLTDLSPTRARRRWVNRWSAAGADLVLSVSHHAARMMHEEWGIPAEKIRVVADGVDVRRFHPAKDEGGKAQTRRQLGLPEAAPMAICVANCVPIKALDVLIRAWREVMRVRPKANLLIAGDGPLRSELKQLTTDLGCAAGVRLLGRREDVPELLRTADLFVLASRYEGTCNAVQEAMASGLAVIATAVGGTPELIDHRRTGWLVPADDPSRLADAILTAFEDAPGRVSIGRAARQAMQSLSIDRWVQRHAELYRELAGTSPICHHVNREGEPCAV